MPQTRSMPHKVTDPVPDLGVGRESSHIIKTTGPAEIPSITDFLRVVECCPGEDCLHNLLKNDNCLRVCPPQFFARPRGKGFCAAGTRQLQLSVCNYHVGWPQIKTMCSGNCEAGLQIVNLEPASQCTEHSMGPGAQMYRSL